jgi:outer membrane protein OmpA-like peptidoglycan-associated protein
VVILLGGWLILNRNRQAAPARGGAADQTYSAVQNAGQNTVASLRSLNLTPGGAADRLAKTLASGGSATPVELQGLNFDETGNLTETAQANLREIGSVLQASPRLRITVTAYGKTSDEGLARADAIKTALVARGVSADRVAAKGDSGEGAPVISFSK